MTTRYVAALMRKHGATPTTAISNPATAGPMMRVPLNSAELKPTALTISSRPTISTTKA